MPRPKKCRMVGHVPDNSCFYPQRHSREEVVLSIEEVEALRLSDFLEMEQDGAAESMQVSRGTFQRMIHSARKKTADALVHGKAIRIDGGNFSLDAGRDCCKRLEGICFRKHCIQGECYEEKIQTEVKKDE